MNILKKYLYKREVAFGIYKIIDMGMFLKEAADKMSKSNLYKPCEIEGFVNECKITKKKLIEIIYTVSFTNNIIPEKLINNIETQDINTLLDCKKIGELAIELGNTIKKIYKINLFYIPVCNTININILDSLCLLIVILFYLKLCILK